MPRWSLYLFLCPVRWATLRQVLRARRRVLPGVWRYSIFLILFVINSAAFFFSFDFSMQMSKQVLYFVLLKFPDSSLIQFISTFLLCLECAVSFFAVLLWPSPAALLIYIYILERERERELFGFPLPSASELPYTWSRVQYFLGSFFPKKLFLISAPGI